jgi:hypothetical protein
MNHRDALPINIVIVAPAPVGGTNGGYANRYRREPTPPPPSEERARPSQAIPTLDREELRRRVSDFRRATEQQRSGLLKSVKAMLGTT